MVTVSPLNSVFNRMVTLSRAMDDAPGRVEDTPNGGGQYWVPALDAWETDQAFMVQLDLPGVNAGDIDVNFDRNTLTVRGTRHSTIATPEKGETRVFLAERALGAFSRSLRFPSWVDAARITASFEHGVLTVSVPKADTAKPRKIEIGSN
jgi:HSP20 family protein